MREIGELRQFYDGRARCYPCRTSDAGYSVRDWRDEFLYQQSVPVAYLLKAEITKESRARQEG